MYLIELLSPREMGEVGFMVLYDLDNLMVGLEIAKLFFRKGFKSNL